MFHSFIGLSMSIPHLAHFVTFFTRLYVGDMVCLQPVGLMRGSPCHRPSTIPHRGYMSVPITEHACFPSLTPQREAEVRTCLSTSSTTVPTDSSAARDRVTPSSNLSPSIP
jgi:hypothetical protein